MPFSNTFTPYATVAPLMLVHPLAEEIDIIGAGTSSVNFLWGFNDTDVSPDNLTPDGAWLLWRAESLKAECLTARGDYDAAGPLHESSWKRLEADPLRGVLLR